MKRRDYRFVNLRDYEVRALLERGEVLVVRPMAPQPTRIVTEWAQDAEVGECVIFNGWPTILKASNGRNKRAAGELTPHKLRCPFGALGQRLVGREAWVAANGGPLYKATYKWACDFRHEWRSATQMPLELVRPEFRNLVNGGVEVMQIMQIEEKFAQRSGVVFTEWPKIKHPNAVVVVGGKSYPFPEEDAPGWHTGSATRHRECLPTARGALLWAHNAHTRDKALKSAANPYVWCCVVKKGDGHERN